MADLEKKEAAVSADVAEKAADKKKEKAKKASPKKKKTSLFAKIKKFFKDYKSELKKIVWCDRKTTLKFTVFTLVSIVIVSAFIGVLDLVFTQVLLKWLPALV